MPETADLVMYWWNVAAGEARASCIRRFGLITTNSITQTFNRSVLQAHLEADAALSLVFAIPDHPWVDSATGAAVRIAMTVGQAGSAVGSLQDVVQETEGDDGVVEASPCPPRWPTRPAPARIWRSRHPARRGHCDGSVPSLLKKKNR